MKKCTHVIITGASSGIGYAFAKYFLQHNCFVIAISRNHGQYAELLKKYPKTASFIKCNLSNSSELLKLSEKLSTLPEIDILINNAGADYSGYFELITEKTMLDLTHLGIDAILLLTKTVLPLMKQKKNGLIINIGSLHGEVPSGYITLYASIKSFLHSFSLALDKETKPYNVRVKLICAGLVYTNLRNNNTLEKRVFYGMEPDRLAQLVMRKINNNSVIITPSIANQLYLFFLRLLPKEIAVQISTYITKKRFSVLLKK